MSSMPAMQAVIEVLESEGVDTIFGIPGAAILPFYDALRGSIGYVPQDDIVHPELTVFELAPVALALLE